MSQSPSDVYVSLEFTPNPNTLKYAVNRELLSKGSMSFSRKEDAEKRSPMAALLLAVPGISSIMIGKDFVTVHKSDAGDWDVVHKNASTIIETHLKSGSPIFSENAFEANSAESTSEIESKIKEILDQ